MSKLIVLFGLFSLLSSCSNAQERNNRELLRQYFLCSCLSHAYDSIGVNDIDHSKSTYFDILRYELPAMQKIDSMAIVFVNGIELSNYENRNRAGYMILCIEEYESKRMNQFIMSMDKYMLSKD